MPGRAATGSQADMTSPRFNHLAAVFAVLAMAMPGTPASAESPDGFLLSAAFATRNKAIALARIESGLKAADLLIARNPHDHEALLQHAVALSYRGKLTR